VCVCVCVCVFDVHACSMCMCMCVSVRVCVHQLGYMNNVVKYHRNTKPRSFKDTGMFVMKE